MLTTDTPKFTRADYAQLPEGFPAFLLNGALVRDASPTWGHQALVVELILRLSALAPGRVLTSPVDVVIDDLNVLQPDVLVLRHTLGSAGSAAPDGIPVLVMEVLSPATVERDRGPKSAAYVRAGVAEVWLIDPDARTIDVVTPAGSCHHDADDTVESTAVPGFRLSFSELVS